MRPIPGAVTFHVLCGPVHTLPETLVRFFNFFAKKLDTKTTFCLSGQAGNRFGARPSTNWSRTEDGHDGAWPLHGSCLGPKGRRGNTAFVGLPERSSCALFFPVLRGFVCVIVLTPQITVPQLNYFRENP